MGNNIFDTILTKKIKDFESSFSDTSETIFIDKETGKLIHPGEFGMYRERVLKEFLRLIVPHKLEITDGFVISNNDYVSTQCDIIIYDKKTSPQIETEENQSFYPIESVVGIGEVKSKIEKHNLIKALIKLAQAKLERSKIKVSSTVYREVPVDENDNKCSYDAEKYPNDQIVTFLICKEFDFKFENFIYEINEEYEKNNIPVFARHNIVLSLKDGIILYKTKYEKTICAPILFGLEQNNRLVKPENKYDHIRIFATNLFLAISTGTIIYPEMSSYIHNIPEGQISDTKN